MRTPPDFENWSEGAQEMFRNFQEDVLDTDGFRRNTSVLTCPKADAPYMPTTWECVGAASHVTGIPDTAILSRAQTAETSEARMLAMALAASIGHTQTYIGERFDRDHTTVMHAVRKMKTRPQLMRRAEIALQDITRDAL